MSILNLVYICNTISKVTKIDKLYTENVSLETLLKELI